MEETSELKKYKQTNLIDALIISVASILACFCFVLGLYVIAYVFVAIATGFFAKTLVLKSYITSAIAAIISMASALSITLLLYKISFTPVILLISFIFCGGALALFIIKNQSKVKTVVLLTAILVLLIILTVFYSYVMKNSNVSFDGFIGYIKDYFTNVQNEFEKVMNETLSTYIDSDNIKLLAESLFTLVMIISVGVIVMAMQFVSMISMTFFKLSIKMSNAEVVIPSGWIIEPHKIVARIYYAIVGLYFISMLISTFGGTAMLPIYYIAINLLLILSPVFIAVGVRRGIEIFAKRKTIIPIIVIILIVLALFQPLIIIYLLGTIGASYTIIKAKRDEKLQEDEDNENGSYKGSYDSEYDQYKNDYMNDNNFEEYNYSDNGDEYNRNNSYDDNEDDEDDYYDEKYYGYREKNDSDEKKDE